MRKLQWFDTAASPALFRPWRVCWRKSRSGLVGVVVGVRRQDRPAVTDRWFEPGQAPAAHWPGSPHHE